MRGMTGMKMWSITIRIKRNDQLHGKPLHKELIEFLMEPLLPQIKRMVNDNGVLSLDEVEVF